MSRLYLIVASVLLLGGLYACSEETGTSREDGELTDEETRYLVAANRILADANAAFRPIHNLLIGSETVSDSAVASSAEQLHELDEEAADLEPPTRFNEEHSLLATALDSMGQTAELTMASIETGDEDSFEAARAQADEAFDLLKQASGAFISEAQR